MGHGRYVVFDGCLLEAEMGDSLGRQRNIVVAVARMAYQQTLFLFKVFQRPDEVRIRVGAGASKEFLCQNACVLLFLKEA